MTRLNCVKKEINISNNRASALKNQYFEEIQNNMVINFVPPLKFLTMTGFVRNLLENGIRAMSLMALISFSKRFQ